MPRVLVLKIKVVVVEEKCYHQMKIGRIGEKYEVVISFKHLSVNFIENEIPQSYMELEVQGEYFIFKF